jgi:hypothetical protein
VHFRLALEQPAKLLGEENVIGYQGSGAAEKPDSQEHQ